MVPRRNPSDTKASAAADDFDQFCREHSADLVNFASLVAGDRQIGRDLAQDALLELWRRWPMELDDPTAYLHTVVIRRQHRLGTRFWNRERSVEHPPEPPPVPGWDSQVVDRQTLVTAINSLPARQREALVLVHVADWSTAEAALVLGTSPAAVRSLCERGRTALRTTLDQGARDE